MKITEITRRSIFDYIMLNDIIWSGRIDETEFVARLYDTKSIQSFDYRYPSFAGDIRQHRINNYDWDDYWIFTDERTNLNRCDDEEYLRFLCEMIHPVVRPDLDEVNRLLVFFNSELKNDGYELYPKEVISGRSVYGYKKISELVKISKKKELIEILSSEYINQQISVMENSIESSPHIAIGLSKELIETVLKKILIENGNNNVKDLNIPQLLKEVSKILKLVPKDVSDEKKGADKIRQILASLGTIVTGIAELRNDYGSGHGKDHKFIGLQARHAKLAVGSASTLVIFLLDTWEQMKKRGSI